MKKRVLVAGISSILALSSFAYAAPAPAPGEEKGFEEFPIGDEVTVGPLHISAVYFQPVDMEPAGQGGLPASKSDMHIEADISAVDGNNLGYGVGDFVPYLTIKYKIQKMAVIK